MLINSLRIRLWRVWDAIYPKLVGLKYINKKQHNIFRVALRKHKGPTLVADDGSVIRKGDYIGELHLYNLGLLKRLQQTDNSVRWAIMALQEVRSSLPELASFINNDRDGKKMKALVARTILHRGAKQLGFQTQDIPYSLYAAVKIPYLRWVFKFCHPQGKQRMITGQEKLIPKYVYISRVSLIQRYGGTKSAPLPQSIGSHHEKPPLPIE